MDQTRDDAFGLYQRCISSGVVEYLQKRAQVKVRRSIYTAQVVIWLMILRRLQPKGTLATSVESLLAGEADGLLSGCPRARQKRISRRTGGYSHARQRLPKRLCWQVMTELVVRLREILNPGGGCLSYLLDGSSLELEASPSLRKAYPPAETSMDALIGRYCASWCCMIWKRAWPRRPNGGPCTGPKQSANSNWRKRPWTHSHPVRP